MGPRKNTELIRPLFGLNSGSSEIRYLCSFVNPISTSSFAARFVLAALFYCQLRSEIRGKAELPECPSSRVSNRFLYAVRFSKFSLSSRTRA